MERLIDADAIIRETESIVNFRKQHYMPITEYEALLGYLKKLPTVDAAPVVHGEWRYYSTTMQECSNCHRHTARHLFKYCPHCGAIMEDKYNEAID